MSHLEAKEPFIDFLKFQQRKREEPAVQPEKQQPEKWAQTRRASGSEGCRVDGGELLTTINNLVGLSLFCIHKHAWALYVNILYVTYVLFLHTLYLLGRFALLIKQNPDSMTLQVRKMCRLTQLALLHVNLVAPQRQLGLRRFHVSPCASEYVNFVLDLFIKGQ